MKVVDAVAKVLKAEGVEYLFAYPVNPIIEAAAKLDIRTIIVRQERIGLHMADAMSRMTSGQQIGVFCMQSGPGSENAFGGVAQAYGDSAPIVVLPMGYSRPLSQIQPNFNSALNYRHVTKSCEQLTVPEALPEVMRRAFTQVRNGRPRPALVEIPGDLMSQEVPEPFEPTPVPTVRYGPDSTEIEAVADALIEAECPVTYAGQGVHYAQAWDALKELAELLAAPVTTSLGGKSAFPENHPLALGSGGRSIPKPAHHFLQKTDLLFGIGCSFSRTNFGVTIPEGKRVIHATLDPADINKDVPVEAALVGDARLILEDLVAAVRERSGETSDSRTAAVTEEISNIKAEWLEQWSPKLTSDEVPMTPYRVIWDLMHTVDIKNTIITHDAGSPRDQLSPFWQCESPLSYIGWGKTTQLGYGLGLAMGQNSQNRMHSASTFGAMRQSVLPEWTLKLQCVNEFRFYLSYLTISLWQLKFQLCPYLPRNIGQQTFLATTLIWQRRSVATASALKHQTKLYPLSSAVSKKHRRVFLHCLNLSQRRKFRFLSSNYSRLKK